MSFFSDTPEQASFLSGSRDKGEFGSLDKNENAFFSSWTPDEPKESVEIGNKRKLDQDIIQNEKDKELDPPNKESFKLSRPKNKTEIDQNSLSLKFNPSSFDELKSQKNNFPNFVQNTDFKLQKPFQLNRDENSKKTSLEQYKSRMTDKLKLSLPTFTGKNSNLTSPSNNTMASFVSSYSFNKSSPSFSKSVHQFQSATFSSSCNKSPINATSIQKNTTTSVTNNKEGTESLQISMTEDITPRDEEPTPKDNYEEEKLLNNEKKEIDQEEDEYTVPQKCLTFDEDIDEQDEEFLKMDFDKQSNILSSCLDKIQDLREELKETRKKLAYKNSEILDNQTELLLNDSYFLIPMVIELGERLNSLKSRSETMIGTQ